MLVVSWVASGTSVAMEAQALEVEDDDTPIDDGRHWIAVGFSTDDNMGEDTVIMSSQGFDDGEQSTLYYNLEGHKGPVEVGDNSGIQQGTVRKATLRVTSTRSYVVDALFKLSM